MAGLEFEKVQIARILSAKDHPRPWPDPLLQHLHELIERCSRGNNHCSGCPERRLCRLTWDRLGEIADVRALSLRDFNLFYKRFSKILRITGQTP